MGRGTVVELLLTNGSVDGIVVAAIANKVDKAVKIPKGYVIGCERTDLSYAGVYLLFGKGADGSASVFIGTAGNVLERLRWHVNHDGSKSPIWDTAVCLMQVGTTGALLDLLAFNMASTGRFRGNFAVSTDVEKPKERLSDAQLALVSDRFEDASTLLNVLGYRLLSASPAGRGHAVVGDSPVGKSASAAAVSSGDAAADQSAGGAMDRVKIRASGSTTKRPSSPSPKDSSATIFHCSNKRGARGQGRPVGQPAENHFLVLKGSRVSSGVTDSFASSCPDRFLRDNLVNSGVIVNGTFQRDYEFTSPSTAATVLLGNSSNGRTEWKTEGGTTLKKFQESSGN